VRSGVRIGAGGAGSGWGAWDQPRDALSVVRAAAAISLRRDIVIIFPPWARSRQAHALGECGRRAKDSHHMSF